MISRYVNSRILCVETFKGEIKKHYRLFKIIFAASVAISIIAILALSSFNSGLIFLPLIIVLVAVVSDVALQKDWRKNYSNVDPVKKYLRCEIVFVVQSFHFEWGRSTKL